MHWMLLISRVARHLGSLGRTNSNMFNMCAIISMTNSWKLKTKTRLEHIEVKCSQQIQETPLAVQHTKCYRWQFINTAFQQTVLWYTVKWSHPNEGRNKNILSCKVIILSAHLSGTRSNTIWFSYCSDWCIETPDTTFYHTKPHTV